MKFFRMPEFFLKHAARQVRASSQALAFTLAGLPISNCQGSELDKFNPTTTDPDRFRIAVRHSDRLQVPPGGAKMRLLMKDRTFGAVLKVKEIVLEETGKAAKDLPPGGANENVSIYRIPKSQIEELRALQARFHALPPDRRNALQGSLQIDIAGCKVDPADTGRMLVSTYVKSSELPDFVVLETEYDLRNVPAGFLGNRKDPVRPCT